MIQLLRIDDALLHGQVAVFWINATASNMILIANDKYATTPMLKMSLQVGKPQGIDLNIQTVNEAIEYLKSPTSEKNKILVVVGSVQDALAICSDIKGIPEINLGGIRNATGKQRFSQRVHLNQEEAELVKQLHDLGLVVSCRETPMSNRIEYEEIKKTFNL